MAIAPALRFLVYGVTGAVIESAFTSAVASAGKGRITVRGPSTWLMVPLYGLALPLFEPLHDALRGDPVRIRGAAYAAGIIGVETLSGLAWRRVTGRVPWEYRSGLAIRGVTRLDYAPVWAFAGLAAERLHDAMVGRRPAGATREKNLSSGAAGVLR
jgi:hypothetical protein